MQAVATGSPSCPFLKVRTKISVWRPAGSIGLSSNDSAPDPVGTVFPLTGGFKSSVHQAFSQHANQRLLHSRAAFEAFVFPPWRPRSVASHHSRSHLINGTRVLIGKDLEPGKAIYEIGSSRKSAAGSRQFLGVRFAKYSSRHTKWPRDPLLSWFDLRELARLRFDPSQCT
jgi:hypothetical protein